MSAREVKEELNKSLLKESEVIIKKRELEKRYEALELEFSTARADLKLAVKRIEDLQSAIQGDLEDSISDNSERYCSFSFKFCLILSKLIFCLQ